mmetsp:Transcript_6958/g.6134  ORF Transcript_6958/g.6134 Transcript_6958/m.6134 type:complete len:391 (+) Transcript_6958:3-1175(+)
MVLKFIFSTLLLTASLTLICLYIHQLPYIPLETDYSKALPELSSTEPLELLDPKTGLLRQEGWSTYPNKWLYNPNMNKAYVPVFNRQKFWNYYYIISDDYLITMAHTDVGLCKGAYISLKNTKDLSKPLSLVQVNDILGSHVSIDNEKNGPGVYSTITHEDLNMTFSRRPENSFATIDVNASSEAGNIVANFKADSKDIEGIAYVSAEPNTPTRHSFKYKLQSKYTGDLKVNGKSLITCTEEKPCYGILDNARGFSGYTQTWVWASTCFEAQGHRVSLNLEKSTDNPHSSWDTVVVDGKLYKLDSHVLYRVTDDHWKWERAEDANTQHGNKINLEFKKADQHSVGANFLFYNIDLQSSYGFFSGTIETSDGKKVKFEKVFGFVEDFHARW